MILFAENLSLPVSFSIPTEAKYRKMRPVGNQYFGPHCWNELDTQKLGCCPRSFCKLAKAQGALVASKSVEYSEINTQTGTGNLKVLWHETSVD